MEDLVGSGGRPSLAAAAALQLQQAVQWTGEERELQDKEELEKKQEEQEEEEEEEEEKETWQERWFSPKYWEIRATALGAQSAP